MTFDQISTRVAKMTQVLLVDHHKADELKRIPGFAFGHNVIITATSGLPGFLQGNRTSEWPKGVPSGAAFIHSSSTRGLVGAVIEAVERSWGLGPKKLGRQSYGPELKLKVGAAHKEVILAKVIVVEKSVKLERQ
jgi:hypothetical protein